MAGIYSHASPTTFLAMGETNKATANADTTTSNLAVATVKASHHGGDGH